MSEHPALVPLRRLRALTEAQLAAARCLDGRAISQLGHQRQDAIYAVQVALQGAPPPDAASSEALLEEAKALRKIELRLGIVAETALSALGGPGANRNVYGPSGRLAAR